MARKYRKLEKRLYMTFKQQLVWVVSTAFAIAAALFWKDTITQAMNAYMSGSTLSNSFYASIIFTLIAVVVIWILNEIFKE